MSIWNAVLPDEAESWWPHRVAEESGSYESTADWDTIDG